MPCFFLFVRYNEQEDGDVPCMRSSLPSGLPNCAHKKDFPPAI
nr:MAG TPA: hypothetical protein [Bacteriophage sp.]